MTPPETPVSAASLASPADLDLLTPEQIAAPLGCAPTTVEDLLRAGDLPGLLLGRGGWLTPRSALIDRLRELAIEQAAERRAARTPKPAGISRPGQDPQPDAPSRPGRRARPLPRLVEVGRG